MTPSARCPATADLPVDRAARGRRPAASGGPGGAAAGAASGVDHDHPAGVAARSCSAPYGARPGAYRPRPTGCQGCQGPGIAPPLTPLGIGGHSDQNDQHQKSQCQAHFV